MAWPLDRVLSGMDLNLVLVRQMRCCGRSSSAADTPANSNNVIHKGLAFQFDWSATVLASRARERPGILPRGRERYCGASVVRPDGRSN